MKLKIIFFSFFLALLLLYPLRKGYFWIIDDHEIIRINQVMQKENGIFLKKIERGIQETEIVQFGETPRYRPVYYFLRVLRIYFFQDHYVYWFLANFFIFLSCLIVVGLTLSEFLPLSLTCLGVYLLAAMPFNADLWGRLGPAEIDASFCFFVFVYSLIALKKGKRFSWFLICTSAALAVGIKENFLILMVPVFFLFICLFLKKRLNLIDVLYFLLPIMMSIWVICSLKLYFTLNSNDIYGQSIALVNRLALLFGFVFNSPRFVLLLIPFLLIYVIYFCFLRNSWHNEKFTLSMLIFFALLVGWNYFFYNGQVPMFSRYALLDQSPIVFMFSLIFFPLHLHKDKGWYSQKLAKKHIMFWCVILVITALPSFWFVKAIIETNISKTNEFKKFLDEMQQYSEVRILNVGEPIHSYEPYYSLLAFSKASMLPKVSYLPYWAEVHGEFSKKLQSELKFSIKEDKNRPLSKDIALIEFGSKGWFKLIKHSEIERGINNLVLLSSENKESFIDKVKNLFLIKPPHKEQLQIDKSASVLLAVDKNRPYRFVVHFQRTEAQNKAFFAVNNVLVHTEMLTPATKQVEFDVSFDIISRSPTYDGLIKLEICLENSASNANTAVQLLSIDLIPRSLSEEKED